MTLAGGVVISNSVLPVSGAGRYYIRYSTEGFCYDEQHCRSTIACS